MIYILGLVVVMVVAIVVGIVGARCGIPAWVSMIISALFGGLFMYALSSSQANAMPVDVEAFKHPVTYRECRPLTVDDVNSGKDSLPLPPECAPDKRHPKQ